MNAPIVHTARSASDAEVWLADLELDSGRPLTRVTWDKVGGGRIKVTVELDDVPVTGQGAGDSPDGAGQCAACGGQLPRQTGPGRRRRYCSDTCRYRDKQRRPRAPRCQMRAGTWRCTQQADWVIREAEFDGQPGSWVAEGFSAAVCGLCVDACTEFAVLQPDVWHVEQQPMQEWLTEVGDTGTGDNSETEGGTG